MRARVLCLLTPPALGELPTGRVIEVLGAMPLEYFPPFNAAL